MGWTTQEIISNFKHWMTEDRETVIKIKNILKKRYLKTTYKKDFKINVKKQLYQNKIEDQFSAGCYLFLEIQKERSRNRTKIS